MVRSMAAVSVVFHRVRDLWDGYKASLFSTVMPVIYILLCLFFQMRFHHA